MEAQDAAVARLIERVRDASARSAPLDICGGGSKRFYGESPAGSPCEVTELAGISSYEPTELVVTARAGTRLAELEKALAECGQCLPFEPPRFGAAGTVGGMVASGLSGPARASVGSVRDHVLGVTLLNGRGEILTFGGQVTKNVAGYDVSRLLVGSLGILGIICEVSLKVLPISVSSETLCFEWGEAKTLDNLCRWRGQPLPISASAWYAGRLCLRLAGASAAVTAACSRLGGERMQQAEADAWWLSVRDQSANFFVPNAPGPAPGESLWRLSVPAAAKALTLSGLQFIEWGGAQRWWRSSEPAAKIRDTAKQAGGHATLVRGADKTAGVFAPLSAALMRVHAGLKDSFDPARIFNPGRLYPGL